MRNFRLTAAAAFLTALIAGPSWGYTPGTYEASAQGMKGPVKVAVTFSKDAVTSVKVIEEKETAGIGTTAAAELPRQIVEAQSTKIDGLSGATVTSKAIFAAVEDSIPQAKGDPNQPARSTAPKHAGKTIEAAEDVVIIGSGFSGLAAAVNAAEHGARVTVLEKMSVTGGASAICGGQWAIMGTKLQKEKGVPYDPPQALVYDLIGNGHLKNDLTTLTMFAENSPRAADWAINRFKPEFIDQKLQYRAEFQFDRSLYLKGGCGPAYRKVE
ncbi:FAD-dependent oxidoreductase [Sutterella wadsworthensis]